MNKIYKILDEIMGDTFHIEGPYIDLKHLLKELIENNVLTFTRKNKIEKIYKQQEKPKEVFGICDKHHWHSPISVFQKLHYIFTNIYNYIWLDDTMISVNGVRIYPDLQFKNKNMIFVEIGSTKLSKLIYYPQYENFESLLLFTHVGRIFQVTRGQNFSNKKLLKDILIKNIKEIYRYEYNLDVNTILLHPLFDLIKVYSKVEYAQKILKEMRISLGDKNKLRYKVIK